MQSNLQNAFVKGIALLKGYIKVALHNVWKYKGHSVINVFGLVLCTEGRQ